jgi:flagellar assembly protein FliH
MGLIRASEVPTKAALFSMKDVETHAAALIERAKKQAESLILAAEAEGDRIRAERHAQGFEEGKKAGLAKGVEEGRKAGHSEALKANSAKLEALVSALAGAAKQLEESRRQLEADTVADVIRLSVAIARRVTKQLGDVEPAVAKHSVAEALRMVVHASAVKVAVHPAQLAVLEAELPHIRAMFPKIEQVELFADPLMSPGGCRLYTGSGIVDADLDGQLDRVVADLLPPGMSAPT